eukprot:s719_g24.t1
MPKVGLAASKAKPKKRPAKEQSHADGADGADAATSKKFSPLQYYEEIRHLGSGAFGSAVLVRRIKDGRRLVAKKCSVKDMEEKQRNMCFEEIALLQKVRHECIAQLVDFVWASKDMLSYWIVLKFYPGGDVQSEIDTCRENDLELPMGKVKNWVTQLCMALKHVHKLRIVHRDVKGSNMFITGARNIVLGDFGVSKQLSESQQKAMTSVGSPMYMAPEWWDGRGGTANSDMWSVGVVLYELLAMRRPFEAQNVLSLVHKITTEDPAPLEADPQLSILALELLNKRPEQRPTAAQALESKGLEDAEKILQIYREALEKKSDRHQRRLAREEDAAAGKKPRPSRSSSISSECESSGNAAGLRAVNLVDIARRQAAAPSAVDEEEGFSEEDDEDSSSSWGSEDSEEEEEEEEEAPLATDSDASKDSWSGVPVEFEDAQSLAEVLAGAKKKGQVGAAVLGAIFAMGVIDVSVLNLSGRYFHFQVKPEQSAADLKSLVASSWKVPYMCLKISIEMRVVEDDEIVASLCESGRELEVSALVVSEKLYDAIENGRLVERAAALTALPQIAQPGDGRALGQIAMEKWGA